MRRSSLDLRITLGVVFLLALAAYQLQGTSVEAAENDTRGFVERESLPQQTDDEDYDPEANLPYLFAVFYRHVGGAVWIRLRDDTAAKGDAE